MNDPVCGMDVDASATGAAKSEYKGTAYYFCNPSCKDRFDRNPEKYLNKSKAVALAGPETKPGA